ncbi:PREDICTED: uncharacterized protein LOC105556945 [Vollenhovia emeryi]|uniref:uncharacterized protein LOC105556945 n=1 Tax=Vollenhovia emeryi TaxID=411798 RepID=UPI0005F4DB5C|nr:PREDICTED: uncharacterized protein LOC105556945 [Vollenhovia emeryi]
MKPHTQTAAPPLTVKNLSSQTLSPAETAILAKGHNFAVTPSRIPTEEIISQIETAIFHLPPEAGNNIRQQSAQILRKAKLSIQNINREERLALRSIKQNDDILILPADKGNTTVVMDKKDYHNKVNTLLSDAQVYKKLKRDPTTSVEKKTSSLIKKANLPPLTTKYLTPSDSSAPRLYGLPKIHKESVPLRPIVSNIGGPTYQLARYLTKPLQKLTGLNDSHIRNSTGLREQNNQDKNQAQRHPEHCLNSTYFRFEGEFYEQTTGAAMGSPISPIIANIFMEHFENEILKKAPLKPSTWSQYVDDTVQYMTTFFIWNHGRETLPHFLTFINSQHPNIQFTMETEQNSQIPFLDVLVRRNEDGTLSHNVYRKPTHTDRYLHANSHHHPAQKNSVISSLVHIALSISEPAALNGELNHLHRTLTRNGYSSRNINRTIKKLTNKESGQNNNTTPETEKEKIKAMKKKCE